MMAIDCCADPMGHRATFVVRLRLSGDGCARPFNAGRLRCSSSFRTASQLFAICVPTGRLTVRHERAPRGASRRASFWPISVHQLPRASAALARAASAYHQRSCSARDNARARRHPVSRASRTARAACSMRAAPCDCRSDSSRSDRAEQQKLVILACHLGEDAIGRVFL